MLAELPRGRTLVCTDLAANVVSHNEYGSIEVVSALAYCVGDLIDCIDGSQELFSELIELVRLCEEHSSPAALLGFILSHLLAGLYGVDDEPTSISLDGHQFSHVALLVDGPVLVELLEKPFYFGPHLEQVVGAQGAEVC